MIRTLPLQNRVTPEGEIVAVSELVVNLQAEDGNLHYLRVGLALILAKGANAEVMKEETAIASDAAIELLGEKTFEELLDPAEKKTVRDELSELVVERYGAKKVQGILFTTFVMQ